MPREKRSCEAVSCQQGGSSETPWAIREAVTDGEMLRKQKGVWSMWFLLPTGSRGSVRSAKAAPAFWEAGCGASPVDLHMPVPGSLLTEVRGDVLTQSELLGTYSGESFLSWVSVPSQERRHCIGRWVHAQHKYLSQTKYDHFIQ